ncbi:MAG: restriction endonuclease, SacI family [Trueperaceae bacterium]|nr:restriction endonuclease, SacI family [Trueperaceae bacterium]
MSRDRPKVARSDAFDAAFARATEIASGQRARGPATQWLETVRQLRAAPSSTFLPMFATAALARATDPKLDPLALKASSRATEGLKPYSARGIATNHLMRLAHVHDLDLGTTGNEPLNNAPFYGADRVDEIKDRVHANARSYFEDLVNALIALRRASQEDATNALAAVIQLTRRVARPVGRPAIVHEEVDAAEAMRRLSEFVERRSERGARGQAVVAGLFRAVHPETTTGGVYEPSHHLPGDVHVRPVPETGIVSLAIEVRQKRVTEAGVLAFARKCARKGIQNAIIVALHPEQASLDTIELARRCLCDFEVGVIVVPSLHELFALIVSDSGQPHHALLQRAADTIADTLVEVGASSEARAEFARLWR